MKVSTIGLGANRFGSAVISQQDVNNMIDAALGLGINFIDTADVYTGGQSETTLGEGLCLGAPALLGGLFHPKVDPADSTAQPLTGRELEILQLAAEGLSNKQMAISLEISEHTVKFHLSSIYTKLGVTSRTEAICLGARSGLVAL